MTAAEIIQAVHEHGGRFAIDASGGHVLRRSKGLPGHLIREVRENARAVKAELARNVEQLTFALPSPPTSATPTPPDFWGRQDRRFDRLCVEFGIAIGREARR